MKSSQALAVTVFVVGFAAPAFAQTPAASAADSAPNMRFQIRTMEAVLSLAVQNGVDLLGQKINEVAPGLRLFAGQPHAHGYQIEGVGWFFDVEVPTVYPGAADLYLDLLPQGARPSNVGNSVAAPRQDPMQAAVVRDPQGEYRAAIREALIDAMIDSGQMPLKPQEMLTVGARRPDPVGPPIVGDETVPLVLSITGEDLALFRQGKITRAEVKGRIKIKEDRR